MPNLFKPELVKPEVVEEENKEVGIDPEPLNNETTYSDIEKWDQMDLDTDLLRGIYAYGYENPSPIQKKAIQPMKDGRDLIAQAQSGTGKTATFTIGALMTVDTKVNSVQVICISPTRELSMQTATVFKGLSEFMENIKVETLLGGVHVNEHIRMLKNERPHIVIGTPGRINDLLRRRALYTRNVKQLILDEADELLSSGFEEQIKSIFVQLPEKVQSCIFSATLPQHIFYITDEFMKDPVKIIVKAEQLTLEGISQYYVAVMDDVQKYDTLIDLYGKFSVSHCIIYANSVKRVTDLHDAMSHDGYPVCCIHSNMSKPERETSLADFRSGKHRVLISSNLTARGIDIQQVSCVINFDISRDISTYLHRIGRSGRWGRKGVGINLITERDVVIMRNIEKYYDTQITEMSSDITI